jgi:hypothetical protein
MQFYAETKQPRFENLGCFVSSFFTRFHRTK